MSESTPLTPDTLESLLRDLDPEEFVAFVADLWSRGGWETEREGPVLTVTRGDETSRMLVWSDDRNRVERALGVDRNDPDAEAIDAVVTRQRDEGSARALADSHDASVIDSSGLHDRLLYAIDREGARELCGTYFGGDIEPRPPREQDRGPRRIEDVVQPRTFLVAVALLALVVGVSVGLSGQPGGGSGGPAAPGTATSTPVITPVGAGAVTAESPDTATSRLPVALRPTSERFEELRANAPAYRNASVSCVGSPDRVVEIAVGALRFNDPERDDGLRTVWRLADTDNASFESFEEGITSPIYRPLFEFDKVAFASPIRETEGYRGRTEGETTLRMVVVARNGSIAGYEFRLQRAANHCWKIDQIFRTRMSATDGGGTAFPTGTATRTDDTADRSRPVLPGQMDVPFAWYDP